MVFKESMNVKPCTKAVPVCNLNHGSPLNTTHTAVPSYENAAYFTVYVAIRRSLSATYTAVDWSLLLRHYVS